MTHQDTTQQQAAWAEEAVVEHDAGAGYPTHATPGTEHTGREQLVLDRIERARRARPRVREKLITLAHGAGGKATQSLIEAIFLEAFRNPLLEPLEDAASVTAGDVRLAFTTDSYVVSPLFFPGGNIGDLAVNGTVNDLAVSGAQPAHLSAGFILEEGFPVEDLRRIVASMSAAAAAAGVSIVTGDTKVVQRGKGDGCYINTAGVGGLLDAVGPNVRAMRDATRGGVATILNEVATAAGVAVVVDEESVPVRPEVRGACELLGIDPLYVACEGRIVAIVDHGAADAAVAALQAHPLGAGATVVGRVAEDPPGLVLLKTGFGGTRIIDLLVGDPLPRIC
ncbi:MAG: hydrogenase expression/formation protein HypE [Pseudonocardia sp.]|nr:hydrogenase expression/formation protein HypE [Pseudonocardia sp.]